MNSPVQNPLSQFFLQTAIVASLSLFVTQSAIAAPFSYTSTGTSNWSTATWNPSTPTSDLDNILSLSSPTGSPMVTTNNISAGFQLNRLNLTNNSSATNNQILSVAGSSLNFVKDSADLLPTIVYSRSVTNGGRIILSAPMTVTDALTITNSAPATGQVTSMTGAITNTGGMTFNGTGPATFTLGTGVISGAGGIAYNGSYTVNSSGANTYGGGTTISAGTLRVNNSTGSGLGTGNVLVNGGKLGGTGAFSGSVTVNSGGTISPGTSVQSLASGEVTLNTGSTFEFEADSSVAVSSGADLLVGSGNFSLNGTVSLTLSNIAVSPTAFADGTTFTLLNYSGSWNSGTFDSLADDSIFIFNSQSWLIDYNAVTGGSNFTGDQIAGNFVNITAVPEPTTCILLGIGLAGLLLRARRRA